MAGISVRLQLLLLCLSFLLGPHALATSCPQSSKKATSRELCAQDLIQKNAKISKSCSEQATLSKSQSTKAFDEEACVNQLKLLTSHQIEEACKKCEGSTSKAKQTSHLPEAPEVQSDIQSCEQTKRQAKEFCTDPSNSPTLNLQTPEGIRAICEQLRTSAQSGVQANSNAGALCLDRYTSCEDHCSSLEKKYRTAIKQCGSCSNSNLYTSALKNFTSSREDCKKVATHFQQMSNQANQDGGLAGYGEACRDLIAGSSAPPPDTNSAEPSSASPLVSLVKNSASNSRSDDFEAPKVLEIKTEKEEAPNKVALEKCKKLVQERPEWADILTTEPNDFHSSLTLKQSLLLCASGVGSAWSDTFRELVLDPYHALKNHVETKQRVLNECSKSLECITNLSIRARGQEPTTEELKSWEELDPSQSIALVRGLQLILDDKERPTIFSHPGGLKAKNREPAEGQESVEPFWIVLKKELQKLYERQPCLKPEVAQEYLCYYAGSIIDPTIAAGVISKTPKLAKLKELIKIDEPPRTLASPTVPLAPLDKVQGKKIEYLNHINKAGAHKDLSLRESLEVFKKEIENGNIDKIVFPQKNGDLFLVDPLTFQGQIKMNVGEDLTGQTPEELRKSVLTILERELAKDPKGLPTPLPKPKPKVVQTPPVLEQLPTIPDSPLTVPVLIQKLKEYPPIAEKFLRPNSGPKVIEQRTIDDLLSTDEMHSIKSYLGDHFKGMNDVLRGKSNCTISNRRCNLAEEGLKKLPPSPGIVYRRLGLTPELLEKYTRIGGIIIDPGFMSTSREISGIRSFGKNGENRTQILMVIDAKTPRSLESIAPNKDEKELLFLPGTPLRVMMVHRNMDGSLVIFLEELPRELFGKLFILNLKRV